MASFLNVFTDDFEDNDLTGWTAGAGWTVTSTGPLAGSRSAYNEGQALTSPLVRTFTAQNRVRVTCKLKKTSTAKRNEVSIRSGATVVAQVFFWNDGHIYAEWGAPTGEVDLGEFAANTLYTVVIDVTSNGTYNLTINGSDKGTHNVKASAATVDRVMFDGWDGAIRVDDVTVERWGDPAATPTLTVDGTSDGQTLGAGIHGDVWLKAEATGITATNAKVYRAATSGGTYTEITSACTITAPAAGRILIRDRRPQQGTPAIALGSAAYYKVTNSDSALSDAASVTPATDEAAVVAATADYIADNIDAASLTDFNFDPPRRMLCYAYAMKVCSPAKYAILKTAYEAIVAQMESTTPITASAPGYWRDTNGLLVTRYLSGASYINRILTDTNGRLALNAYLCSRMLDELGEFALATNARTISRAIAEAMWEHLTPHEYTYNGVTRTVFDLAYSVADYSAYSGPYAPNKSATAAAALAVAYITPTSTLYGNADVLAHIKRGVDMNRACQNATTGQQIWSTADGDDFDHLSYGIWTGSQLSILRTLLGYASQTYSTLDDVIAGLFAWIEAAMVSEPSFVAWGKTGSAYEYTNQSNYDTDYPDNPGVVDSMYYMAGDAWSFQGIDLTSAYNLPTGAMTLYNQYGGGTAMADLDWTLFGFTGRAIYTALNAVPAPRGSRRHLFDTFAPM